MAPKFLKIMKHEKFADFLLMQWYGANTKLAKTMWIQPEAVLNALRRGISREKTKKRYTIAINRTFGTNFTVEDIFEEHEE